MSKKGVFVISLDFELYWGMFDKVTLLQYGENITGVHTALPRLLELFKEREIHATWATVGMLMHENEAELKTHLPPPSLRPRYKDTDLSAYEHMTTANLNGENGRYYFGKQLVQKVLNTPHQELGSHTFSHYYTLEGAENSEAFFRADCDAFSQASLWTNTPVTSIVFPRNQITKEALERCAQKGFTAYRGTPSHFLYTGKSESKQTNPFLRALRLLDTYLNLTGHHTYSLPAVTQETGLTNVAGSWFLRPWNKSLHFLEWLKLRRIKNAMTYAAKHGEVFHLWWHPHNFGKNQEQNFKNLEAILNHFTRLQKTYEMKSLNMHDFTDFAEAGPK